MFRFFALLLMSAFALPAQDLPARGDWKTDLSKRSIDLSELMGGGPPKDGIPAIDDPKFVPPEEAATWLSSKEPVLVIEHAGEVRAYPLQILIWHELVNDQIEGLPVLVSFCPLCNSAIAFDRRIDGEVYDFGVSGMLRNSDMVMYDRQTDSLWQQLTGEAIVGGKTGTQLKIVSSQIVPFEALREAFPQARVLSKQTGHFRPYGQTPYTGYEFGKRFMFPVGMKRPIPVAPLERLVTISMDNRTKAYPFERLRSWKVAEGRINQTRFVIFFDPSAVTPMDAKRIADSKEVGAVGVFSPLVDGKRLKFRYKDGKFIDKQTGSTWNLFGFATEGPMAGRRLEPIEHGVYFAFAWMVFNPDTEVIGVAREPLLQQQPLGGPSRSSTVSPFPGSGSEP